MYFPIKRTVVLPSILFLQLGKVEYYGIRTLSQEQSATFNVPSIRDQIHHMTARFFDTSSTHTTPLVRTIGNYTLDDPHQQYKKYIHKRTKRILL
jgi:hypothetical protein